MSLQCTRRRLCRPSRRSSPHSFSLVFPQTILSNVSGVPFPIGVTGTVAQNNPNTQPEEK
jgi:hypothetical protein